MGWQIALIYGIGLLILLLVLGLEIPFALAIVAFGGLFFFEHGAGALTGYQTVAWTTSTSFILLAVPLFVVMGHILLVSGYGTDLYNAGSKWIGRIPAGLAIGTVIVSAFFGAVTGSGIAATATFGKVSIPELRKRGYADRLIYTTITSVGTLAALIPPSISMVIFGDFTDTSVSQLFFAGLIPGIILAGLVSSYLVARGILHPHMALPGGGASWGARFRSLKPCGSLALSRLSFLGVFTAVRQRPLRLRVLGS